MADQFPLKTARRLAEKIVAEISPFCLRAEIVAEISPFCLRAEVTGSIRREKPLVKDIEIVAIPRWVERPDPTDLFQEYQLRINLLCENLAQREHVQWIKPGTPAIEPWPLKPEGKYWRGLLANGMKLDMFLAEPKNYGAIKLIRTGSMEFNVALFGHAGREGVDIDRGWFWKNGVKVPTPEEEDVFDLLGVQYVEPRERIDGRAVRRV